MSVCLSLCLGVGDGGFPLSHPTPDKEKACRVLRGLYVGALMKKNQLFSLTICYYKILYVIFSSQLLIRITIISFYLFLTVRRINSGQLGRGGRGYKNAWAKAESTQPSPTPKKPSLYKGIEKGGF